MASIKPDIKLKDENGRAIPANNDYRLNKYKSYSLVFSTEVGHETLASCALTRGWHKYMMYDQTREGEFITLPGNLAGFQAKGGLGVCQLSCASGEELKLCLRMPDEYDLHKFLSASDYYPGMCLVKDNLVISEPPEELEAAMDALLNESNMQPNAEARIVEDLWGDFE